MNASEGLVTSTATHHDDYMHRFTAETASMGDEEPTASIAAIYELRTALRMLAAATQVAIERSDELLLGLQGRVDSG